MGQLGSVFTMVLMLAVFYLVIFIPENKRKKKYAALLNNLKVNDEVLTKGGVMGKIINIQDEYIILESGPDRTRIKLSKSGIGTVINLNTNEAVEKK
ncbi:preprotein translocase subunit YajC [Clostridium estertheticum]|uniref:Preprotein translocase subunit YajC n=1 Tax=Clostridium estertheticum TaxID=238834 RepID=A0A7Y3SWT1_9CLOT|nr:preprotein translocase subunit YajC [Clostridium estertheticum]MBW9171094.1 preprotein translocase subunit YajC [Clostridium estertheticum]MBX4266050.1 preprotein translocase subunit YajC [Clostridium estertheticum]MBX4268787.1 preprotein translocase subunit YajC [Clostridium estertheticum]NNU76465.1 preprotein translocase subunit YajC [Clostridium estertheticum]WBL45953.1 preprotein translocase subunit YajC [Clostridium estertheticum]